MARLRPFTSDHRVMVGVSGGGDSMALALLLSRWGTPLACIVDHGLRTGSGEEAALTARRLEAIGVPARVLQAHVQPGSGLAGRAREARYALLFEACRAAGCADLLVAHHARDQAETVHMRRGAGSGAAGLSGMAAIVYKDAARLLRPLLGIAPERLRATAMDAGLEWAEDPTNQDTRTLRARLRIIMDRNAVAAACTEAAAHGAARRQAEQQDAAALADVAIYPEGYAYVPGSLPRQAFSALVWTLSGRPYPPSPAMLAAGLRARTLHGVVIRPAGRLGPGWLLAREPGAAALPVPARAGVRWDGRYTLIDDAGAGGTFGAVGRDAARLRHRSPLPSAVLRGLPSIRRGTESPVIPHLAFPDAAACRSVVVRFCPARPMAGAPFKPVEV